MYYVVCNIHALAETDDPNLIAVAGSINAGWNIMEAVGFSEGKAVLEFDGDTVHTRCMPSQSGEIRITAISEATRRIAFGAEVDLLKLDCEGSEWEILEETESMSHIMRLTMEYHLDAHQTLSDLMEKLGKSGFRVEFQRADGPNYGRIWASR